jgi:hypothetical protein
VVGTGYSDRDRRSGCAVKWVNKGEVKSGVNVSNSHTCAKYGKLGIDTSFKPECVQWF